MFFKPRNWVHCSNMPIFVCTLSIESAFKLIRWQLLLSPISEPEVSKIRFIFSFKLLSPLFNFKQRENSIIRLKPKISIHWKFIKTSILPAQVYFKANFWYCLLLLKFYFKQNLLFLKVLLFNFLTDLLYSALYLLSFTLMVLLFFQINFFIFL